MLNKISASAHPTAINEMLLDRHMGKSTKLLLPVLDNIIEYLQGISRILSVM